MYVDINIIILKYKNENIHDANILKSYINEYALFKVFIEIFNFEVKLKSIIFL
jgi:hypothetical protein